MKYKLKIIFKYIIVAFVAYFPQFIIKINPIKTYYNNIQSFSIMKFDLVIIIDICIFLLFILGCYFFYHSFEQGEWQISQIVMFIFSLLGICICIYIRNFIYGYIDIEFSIQIFPTILSIIFGTMMTYILNCYIFSSESLQLENQPNVNIKYFKLKTNNK